MKKDLVSSYLIDPDFEWLEPDPGIRTGRIYSPSEWAREVAQRRSASPRLDRPLKKEP